MAPTAVRAIKKEDFAGKLIPDLPKLEAVYLAGERCDPLTIRWLQEKLPQSSILDQWWQTETGSPVSGSGMTHPLKVVPGTTSRPCPGWDVQLFDHLNKRIEQPNQTGKIMIKLPLPPGFSLSLWRDDNLFVEKYMSEIEGYYHTGDAGFFDEHGNLSVMERTDDVINVAAHRISTGRLEEVVCANKKVAECAVVGVLDA